MRRWWRALRQSKQGRAGWQVNVVIALVVAFFIWTIIDMRASGPSSEQEVMRLHRDAGLVRDDDSLDEPGRNRSDHAEHRSRSVLRQWVYWATDATVDLDVVVASDDRLFNAAEVVADGAFARELVVSVEREIVGGGVDSPTLENLSRELRSRFGDELLTDYLATAARPADAATLERFVVYAVSESTYGQRVVFIDLDRRDQNAIRRFMNEGLIGKADVRIAGNPSLIDVSSKDCARLANAGTQ